MGTGRFNGRVVVGMLCVLAIGLAGCPRHEAREARVARRAATSLEDMRQELVRADQQVVGTLTAMEQLHEAPVELREGYRTFTGEVSRTAEQGRRAGVHAERMQSHWQQYITTWEQELQEIATPELRAQLAERREEVRRDFDRIREEVNDVQAAYGPFLQQLEDIQRALSLDLTPGGLQATEPALESTYQAGVELRREIAQAVNEIDSLLERRVARPAPTPVPIEPVAGSQ